jgi:DNA-binding response OmpR family regulator
LTSGADDYLAKPFAPKELLARVQTQLDASKARRDLEQRVSEQTKGLLESETRYQYLINVLKIKL